MYVANRLVLTKELIETISHLSPFCMLVFGANGIHFSDKNCEVCMLLADDIINYDFESFQSSLTQEFSNVEHHLVRDDGKEEWYLLQSALVEYEGIEAIFTYVLDITDKKLAELDYVRLSKIRSLMLEVTHSVVNNDEIDVFYSLILKNALEAIEKSNLGSIFILRENYFQCVSYIGFHESVLNFQLPVQHSFLYRATDGAMDQITYLEHIELSDLNYPIKIASGEYELIKSTLSAPIIIAGEVYGMINIDSLQANAFDDSDIKSMDFMRANIEIAITNHLLFQEKSQLAKFDRLTGLHNRSFFEDQYVYIKDKALRYNERFNLVMFDVDALKKINDFYGHFVGDQAIRKIALDIQTSSRKSDIIARFGGDEFIGIFFESDADELSKKFTKLQENLLDNPIVFFEEHVPCTFSFGIASFPQEGQQLEDLTKIADSRMYINKAKRINQY